MMFFALCKVWINHAANLSQKLLLLLQLALSPCTYVLTFWVTLSLMIGMKDFRYLLC